MTRLSAIASRSTVKEYAQGAAQSAVQPIADFLAPSVEVSTAVGHYKAYDTKSRFVIPSTLRSIGGAATMLGWNASDATYNCAPHALDAPIDQYEILAEGDLENAFRERADEVAEIAALAHEVSVVTSALAAVGSGTGKVWGSAGTDPVDDIDTAILSVAAAANYGSLMDIGVLFGVNAWRLFKNNSKVSNRFTIQGNEKTKGLAIPTVDMVGTLFLAQPDVRLSMMVYDTAPMGKSQSLSFLMAGDVLIFARKRNPTRRDPSFMKTFRLRGNWMVPGSYTSQDGRQEIAKMDWSEDVRVTNSAAAARLTITAS